MPSLVSSTTIIFLLLLLPPALSRPPPCPIGHFRTRTSCTPCPPGTYQHQPNATRCLPCPPGTHNPITGALGADFCLPCPAGTFSRSRASLTCQPCPPGQNSHPNARRCRRCPLGHYILYNNRSCRRCSSGIAPNRTTLRCQRCDYGNNLVANEQRTACVTCPLGTVAQSSNECRSCREGFFHDGTPGLSTCLPCPPGTTPNTNHSACNPCPAGTAGSGGLCERCNRGENVGVQGAATCVRRNQPCPDDMFRDERGACKTCGKGYGYNADRNMCERCPPNMFSPGGGVRTAICTRCPPTEVPYSSQDGCSCPSGSMRYPNGRCRRCGAGRWIAPHSTVDYFEEHEADTRSCDRCGAGTYSTGETPYEECKLCPPGSEPNEARSGCQPCPEGLRSFVLGQSQRCVDPQTNCPPGEERQTEDGVLVSCGPTECGPGEHLERAGGVSRCVRCRRGEVYRPNSFREELPGYCARCPGGRVSEDGTECVRCTRGRSLLAMPNGLGYRCGCRSNRWLTGTSVMVGGYCLGSCPDGTAYAGSRSVYEDDGCETCPAGSWGPSIFDPYDLGSCETCPYGTFSATPGSAYCEDCPEGQIPNEDHTGCVPENTEE